MSRNRNGELDVGNLNETGKVGVLGYWPLTVYRDNVDTCRGGTVMTKLCATFQLLNDCQLKIIDMH